MHSVTACVNKTVLTARALSLLMCIAVPEIWPAQVFTMVKRDIDFTPAALLFTYLSLHMC